MYARRNLAVAIGLAVGIGSLVFFAKPEPRSFAQATKTASVDQKLDEILRRLERIEKKLGIGAPTPPLTGTKAPLTAKTLDEIPGDDLFEGKHRKFPKTSMARRPRTSKTSTS